MIQARNLLAIAFCLTAADTAARDRYVPLVPWKVAAPGVAVDAPLVLYWIPASPDDLKRSPLLASSQLVLFASRCVAMRVVRFEDGRRMAELNVGDDLPAVIMTDRTGRILGRLEGELLAIRSVEALVRSVLDERAGDASNLLDRARLKNEAGDTNAAIALYRTVFEQRCVCPREGRDADRALRKLTRR